MKDNINILLIEEDLAFGTLLSDFLQTAGFRVNAFYDTKEAYISFKQERYDMVISELILPEQKGLELLTTLHDRKGNVPIIVFSSHSNKELIVKAYNAGIDDFIPKPCSMDVLLCHVHAVARRSNINWQDDVTSYQFGAFTYNPLTQLLTHGNNTWTLSSREHELLTLLLEDINHLVERSYALRTIWGEDTRFNARSLGVYIAHLRRYLEIDKSVHLQSVHGKGYKLTVEHK